MRLLLSKASPFSDGHAARIAARNGELASNTAGMALEFVQGNLIALPEDLASDFLRFALRNPKPCPLLAVSEPGRRSIPELGVDLDVATDIPRTAISSPLSLAALLPSRNRS